MRENKATIIAVAALLGVVLSGCTSISTELPDRASIPAAPTSTASETPAAEAVAAPEASYPIGDYAYDVAAKYNRKEQFGSGWKDVTGNGCDARNDVLLRDLVEVSFVDDKLCKVDTGRLVDPYTGEEVAFQYGVKTSNEVPIDHILPLEKAWFGGAYTWTQERRIEFANDPLNLTATTQPFNSWKSARSPVKMVECLPDVAVDLVAGCTPPPTGSFDFCFYTARFEEVATKYQLVVNAEDAQATTNMKATCN